MLIFGMLISLTAIAAGNEGYSYFNFATCKAKIEGTPIRLQFFEQYIAGSNETTTGEGILIQTLSGPPEELTMLSKLRIRTSGLDRIVEIAPVLDSEEIFATVTIPAHQKFELEIFATHFNKVWGTFQCESSY